LLGASPRGSISLFKTGQAMAALDGRDFVLPDDIKTLAPYVLSHRVVVSPSARLADVSSTRIVKEILETLPVTMEDFDGGNIK